MAYTLVRTVPADLAAAGRAIVGAFGVRERFFHFEFFRQPAGGLVALEVNVRPPGGFTVDMWNYQSDIAIYRQWADLIVTGQVEVPAERPTFCAYVGRKDRFRYAHSVDEMVSRFGGLLRHHEPIDDVFSAAIGNYGFILRSPDLADLEHAAQVIQQHA